jgi:hypothetical protein
MASGLVANQSFLTAINCPSTSAPVSFSAGENTGAHIFHANFGVPHPQHFAPASSASATTATNALIFPQSNSLATFQSFCQSFSSTSINSYSLPHSSSNIPVSASSLVHSRPSIAGFNWLRQHSIYIDYSDFANILCRKLTQIKQFSFFYFTILSSIEFMFYFIL